MHSLGNVNFGSRTWRGTFRPCWGKFLVAPLQFAIYYGTVIGCTLLGGQSLKVSLSLSFEDIEKSFQEFF
ncbi:hypothetical protein Pint_05895 [Pistacia integerrima]|uniref:Uncharacterized protein n=1 Tax=Pistacia integerrima TaxID=434235 RepID=A0ACC0Z334_9ROSI|nr:hypothetical protein Pint_05895 [Pistacia integerrima]